MAIEQPRFQVIDKVDAVEIRSYEPMNVARTRVHGDFGKVGNKAFRRLAGYIFGDNAGDRKIAMTAPVSQVKEGDEYSVTFMMPSKYTIDELPKPQDKDVELVHLPAQTMAAIRYRGGWSEKLYRANETRLKAAIRDSTKWKISGEPVWARYNSPMMPSIFRTNEILVPVSRIEGDKPVD